MQEFAAHIEKEDLHSLSNIVFSGKIEVVNSMAKAEKAVKYLSRFELLGFDTETKPAFHKGQKHKIALLQLSSDSSAYLFRLHAIGIPDCLAGLLERESIKKIGAAVHDDIKGLQRIRKIKPGGFIDLQHIVPKYGIEDKSVQKIAAIVLNAKISKSQRLTNWENEQLTGLQQRYAATDAWVCREIYVQLVNNNQND
ncbi:MAG: 3'-5' exonuclease domain-containing protein 2 [Prevotellaceae bacterium]|jgi:ribonuclease D|nr:3'-5' exonuclease domain-containing protein 2 [Prevotellaceae bacterium]